MNGDLIGVAIATMAVVAHSADAITHYVRVAPDTAPPDPLNASTRIPGGPTRREVLRNRAIGLALGIAAAALFYFEVHTTAAELASVVAQSPKGSLTSPSGLVGLCNAVRKVADGRRLPVTLLLSAMYLTLQTFCIPGTIALNVVVGALLGVEVGLPLCVGLGTIGATLCYGLSTVAGVRLANAVDQRLMHGQGVSRLRGQVAKYRADLFAYILFLRLTPLLPNWLINLGSPVVSVPLRVFMLATLLGIAPQTYLSVRFGTIARVGSVKAIVTPYDTFAIAMLGVVVLVAWRLYQRFGGRAGAVKAVEM